jgi:hypothetical protein
MKTLENYLKRELGLNVDQIKKHEIPESFSINNEHDLKTEEDFTLKLCEYTEPDIRKKIREFYTQLGYSITNAEFFIEAFCNIFVDVKEMGTLFVETVIHHNHKTAWITVKKTSSV